MAQPLMTNPSFSEFARLIGEALAEAEASDDAHEPVALEDRWEAFSQVIVPALLIERQRRAGGIEVMSPRGQVDERQLQP